jgi:hypothetical protein
MSIEKSHPLKTYTKRTDIKKIDINDYQPGMVTNFLKSL